MKEADVLRVTRLSGPTAPEAEEQVAEYIEEEVARYDRRDLGPRTRRDGRDGSGLRVDFTYDAAVPPVAMEITALVDPDVRELGAELLKFEAELREIVTSENLGAWLVGVRVGTSLRGLRQPLVDLLRRQRDRKGFALFRAGEAPDDLTDGDRRPTGATRAWSARTLPVHPRPNCSKALACCGSCSATTTPSGPTACGGQWQATVAGTFLVTLLASLPWSTRHVHLVSSRPCSLARTEPEDPRC
jgi:hypothetical protein